MNGMIENLLMQIRSLHFLKEMTDEEILKRALERYLGWQTDGHLFKTNKWSKILRLHKNQDGRCYYCGQPVLRNNATLDHKLPRSLGGLSTMDNLVMCCHNCNETKSNFDDIEFREWLKQSNSPPNTYNPKQLT